MDIDAFGSTNALERGGRELFPVMEILLFCRERGVL